MTKIEKRKVQLTGGSTYIVSLPVNWIRDLGIQQGDELFISRQQDRSLIIAPKIKLKDKVYSTTIKIGDKDKSADIFRLMVSYYLAGYDILILAFTKEYAAEDRKCIKESVRERLIALEVVEESSERVMFQSLLNYKQFPMDRAMSNILRIVQSMQKDSNRALLKLDRNTANEVIQRDTEVDRFYLLIVRQLKSALRNPEIIRELGLSNAAECLGYRIVVKNIERIADHLEKIAENSLKITQINPEIIEKIRTIYECNETIFGNIIECLNIKDIKSVNIKLVNKIIDESQKSIELCKKLDENIYASSNLSSRVYLNSIFESLKRISGYSADIAEVILNMSIPEPDLI
ncbi:MAG: phosphate uptake regulator PhoU [ANME-2 cluster archaeon]|nr:phosphate uptake regulator PhoU [ANME-2 cluster archaeon]